MGCESLCDVDNLSTAYGVATNFLEWCFLKNSADEVVEEMLIVGLANNKPTAGSVRVKANKICSILVRMNAFISCLKLIALMKGVNTRSKASSLAKSRIM